MAKEIKLTEEQFEELFTLIENHIEDNASWNGCMFETFGEEGKFVIDNVQKFNNVWTIIDGDEDDNLYVVSGFHLVNRIGYLISREQYSEGQFIEVKIEH